jgi:hypothetical protein
VAHRFKRELVDVLLSRDLSKYELLWFLYPEMNLSISLSSLIFDRDLTIVLEERGIFDKIKSIFKKKPAQQQPAQQQPAQQQPTQQQPAFPGEEPGVPQLPDFLQEDSGNRISPKEGPHQLPELPAIHRR